MRLKLFRGTTITEAMSRVRAELGSEALILATRRVANGVEITAALEPEEDLPPPLPQDPAALTRLLWHGIPPQLAHHLAAGDLTHALGRSLTFAPLPLDAGALLLVGPPGAGKTLTIARLATRLVMQGITPMVITADGSRAGAAEQLAAFTRLLGINLVVASHPVALARAFALRPQDATVLIDAPGTDPFDPAAHQELAGLAATCRATIALVLATGGDPAESADIAQAFRASGATHMVATKLDLARRLGGTLAAAAAGNLFLAESGIGPGAADGLVSLTPALLAERLNRSASPCL